MKTIIEKAKVKFLEMVDSFGSDPYYLLPHVPEAEKWAKLMLRKYPQADEEIVLLSVWLHDIGHYPLPTEIDHAVRGEERAREFLEQEKYDSKKMEEVLHCIRAHRSRDVMPKSLEAKIIAFVDSASHMTDPMYFYIPNKIKKIMKISKHMLKWKEICEIYQLFLKFKMNLLGFMMHGKILSKNMKKLI